MADEFEDEFEDEDCFKSGKTLLIDGDIIIYRPCCTNNEEGAQSQRAIVNAINRQISQMVQSAGCDDYRFFVTTKKNFRDHLVDDYKANRSDVERPIHLKWAKEYAMANLGAECVSYLEADDLLGIYQTDSTVIWSLDKDLRQIPGMHLEDETMQVITVDEKGLVEKRGKKVYFNGLIGFYYQLLIGDSTDYIVGCGKRLPAVYKSGAKQGQSYVKRSGVGPVAAIKVINNALSAASGDDEIPAVLEAVKKEYQKCFGNSWKHQINLQAGLLWMSRELSGDCIKMWTFDGKDMTLNYKTGMLCYGGTCDSD